MRVILAGSGLAAVQCLGWLLEQPWVEVILATPGSQWQERLHPITPMAVNRGIEVKDVSHLGAPAFTERVISLQPDVLVSFEAELPFPPEVLAVPKAGAWNLHLSLLPEHRGEHPAAWAILDGDQITGATFHAISAEAGAGDILGQFRLVVGDHDTACSLHRRLNFLALDLFRVVFPVACRGEAPKIAQDESMATFHGPGSIDFTRAQIMWTIEPQSLFRWIRGHIFDPIGFPFFVLEGRRYSVKGFRFIDRIQAAESGTFIEQVNGDSVVVNHRGARAQLVLIGGQPAPPAGAFLH